MRHHPGQRGTLKPAYMMQPDPPHKCRATLTRICGFDTMPAPLAAERIRIGQIVWIAPEDLATVAEAIGGVEIGAVIGDDRRRELIAEFEKAPAVEEDPPLIAMSIKIDGIEIGHLLSEEEKAGIAAYFAQLDQAKARQAAIAAIADRITTAPAEIFGAWQSEIDNEEGAALVHEWTIPAPYRSIIDMKAEPTA